MFNTDTLLMGIASLLLLVINWLAFHDLREPHTMRDWLLLVASLLIFLQFIRDTRRHLAS